MNAACDVVLLFSGGDTAVTPSAAPLSTKLPPMPARFAMTDPKAGGVGNAEWLRWLGHVGRNVRNLEPFSVALEDMPELTFQDAGARFHITTYNHIVQWTGRAFEFEKGDLGTGYLQEFTSAPTSDGWASCDGSETTVLTVGTTLGTDTVTTPIQSGFYLRR